MSIVSQNSKLSRNNRDGFSGERDPLSPSEQADINRSKIPGFATQEQILAEIKKPKSVSILNIFDSSPQDNIKNVDFFQNIYAKGFTLKKTIKNTDFIVDNKVVNNDTTFPQSVPQQFIDLRGNKTIEFTPNNRAPITNIVESRLLNLHNQNNFLDNYYSKLKNPNSKLGIRNNDKFGFDQPFIIRDIGNQWGIDKVDFDNTGFFGTAGAVVRLGLNVLDELGGVVIGRDPSVYASRALADLGRTAKFIASTRGAGFLLKQQILKRENPQTVRTDVKYGITNDITKYLEDIQRYDPLSLASQPGIRFLQKDINAKSPFPVIQHFGLDNLKEDIRNKLTEEVKELIDNIREYNVTIDSRLNLPTDRLLNAIAPVGEVIKDIASRGVNYLKDIGAKIGLSKLSDLTSGFSLPDVPNPFNNFDNPNQGETLSNLAKKVGAVGKNIQSAAQAFGEVLPKLSIDKSKSQAYKIDPSAFQDLNVDKVNLIPYGTRDKAKYKSGGLDLTEENLDFIPFRFVDMDGYHIVFRAILSGITDTFTPEYSSDRYIGRPDNVYVYQGTTREISFTFDVYPKSAEELPVLWEKMNYLAGLTYPDIAAGQYGQAMVAPFCKLTIGQMYTDAPGYLSGLTYAVQDSSTWETTFAKLPKYIQASCTFIYIGDRLPTKNQKHFDCPWIPEEGYVGSSMNNKIGVFRRGEEAARDAFSNAYRSRVTDVGNISKETANKILNIK